MGACLPHEQYQMLVQRDGLDAWRLSAADYFAPQGFGHLLQAWGDKPEICLDTRDFGVIGLHADGVLHIIKQGWFFKGSAGCSLECGVSPQSVLQGSQVPLLLPEQGIVL